MSVYLIIFRGYRDRVDGLVAIAVDVYAIAIPGFQQGSCCSIFSFLLSAWQIVVCTFAPFLLAIVLSVLLRFTEFDYPFGIFKLLYIKRCLCLLTVTRRMQLVKQEHLNFSERSIVVGFVLLNRPCNTLQIIVYPFLVDHCIVCHSASYYLFGIFILFLRFTDTYLWSYGVGPLCKL